MKIKVLGASAILALALLACQPALLTQLATPSAPVVGSGATGTVKLSVPSVSPTLASLLGATVATELPASRAIMIVTGVDLELWHSGILIDSISVPVVADPSSGGAAPIPWTVPVATDYTVRARVYNGHVSTTQPVLYGVSDLFSVSSGVTTPVTIRPIPIAPAITPVAIPLAPSTVSSSLTSCDIATMTPTPVFDWGQEKWFTVNAAANDAVFITATGDAHSAAVMMAADETGKLIGMGISGAIGDGGPAYFTYGGSARLGVLGGNTRYVGLITLSDTIGTPVTSTVTLKYADYDDDLYEPNDSMAEAHAINSGDIFNGVDLDPLGWTAGAPIGGDWYKFTLGSLDDHNILVRLTYDADWSPLQLRLFDSGGSEIAAAPPATLSGPLNPSALETVEINAADMGLSLGDGDYYIFVCSGGPNVLGSTYQLKYVAGTGTTDITIE